MKKIILLGFLGITILNSGCKKEEDAGNANIAAITFPSSTWTYTNPYYVTNLSVPDITSENLNSASVMVYFSFNSGEWIALPYTQYNSPSQNYIMEFRTTVGNVKVTWFYDTSLSAGDDPNTYYGTTVQLKVVVVSGRMMDANPGLDLTNYEEVKQRLKLED